MKGMADEENTDSNMYIPGVTFELYLNNFTLNNNPTTEALSYEKLKATIMEQYSTKLTEAKMLSEGVMNNYNVYDNRFFVNKAGLLYIQAGFNEKSRWKKVTFLSDEELVARTKRKRNFDEGSLKNKKIIGHWKFYSPKRSECHSHA